MMSNFFNDNDDLSFHLRKMIDWEAFVPLREDFASGECPFDNLDEVVEAYIEMLQDPIGELAANRIAPRASEVDKEGCSYRDGEVVFPEALKNNISDLREAQLAGITLEREYGGLYFPKTFYAAATEIISRADASLMNLFGLQGIGETIQQFGDAKLCEKYLPNIATGEWIAAMLLTEADAGSELGAMRTKAKLDDEGNWRISGTKRFITFGCGEVLVIMARSEDPETAPGTRGISLFVVKKGEGVTVRRIEKKLGIHGSPTCEVHFDNAKAELIGERGKGLSRYGAWLMKEARLGVAAQGVGICQAALEAARKYADEREQFGRKIGEFAQVNQMLVDMQVKTEAARTLLYTASQVLDLEEAYKKAGKKGLKKISRLVDILTPLAKYYAAEASIDVANQAIQVHGGNGFTTEYPVERYLRDARITSIYEGTSQIQVDWAITRILRGGLNEVFAELRDNKLSYDELKPLRTKVIEANDKLDEVIGFVNSKDGSDYVDQVARYVVDMACDVYLSYQFLKQVELSGMSLAKFRVAKRFIVEMLPRVEMNRAYAMADGELELW